MNNKINKNTLPNNSEVGVRQTENKVLTFKAAKPFHSTEFENEEFFKIVDSAESGGNNSAALFQVKILSTFYVQIFHTNIVSAAFSTYM